MSLLALAPCAAPWCPLPRPLVCAAPPAYTPSRLRSCKRLQFLCVFAADPRTAKSNAADSRVANSRATANGAGDTHHALDFYGTPVQTDDAQRVLVEFRVHYQSQPNEHVLVTGNDAALGGWDLRCAVPLKWTDDCVWQTPQPVLLPCDTVQEYKYIVLRDDRERALWQGGENGRVTVERPLEAGASLVVQDEFDASAHKVTLELAPSVGGDVLLLGDEVLTPGVAHILPECFKCGECFMPHLYSDKCPRLQQMHDAAAHNGQEGH